MITGLFHKIIENIFRSTAGFGYLSPLSILLKKVIEL